LQLQKLQRKWKVIPKLAQKFSQWFFGDSFGGSIGRQKSKAVPFFGGLRDDPGGPHGAGCSSTLRSKDRPQRNKHWKDVKQRFQTRRSSLGFSLVTSFSLSFSLNAIPSSPYLALEQRKARARSRSWKCIGQVVPQIADSPLSGTTVHILAEAHIGST